VCVNAGALDQKPASSINDFAGIISQDVKSSLEIFTESLLLKTGVSLVLVTAPSLDGEDIDDFANKLFTKWGIGAKGKDEGILIVLAMKERALRIETGYGAEGYLTDVQAKRIIRDVATPFLSKGQWDQGLEAAVVACAQLAATAHSIDIREIAGYTAPAAHAAPAFRRYKTNPLTILFGVLLLLFLIGTRGGRSILMLLLLSSLTGGRGGYRSSGFGGGSGGFGGFGGGMSGGGGASGRF
jgi:uncharacterized protein